MAEDFQRTPAEEKMTDEKIRHLVLQAINDTLESLGDDINQYHFVPFKYVSSDFERLTREIDFERSIPVPEEDLLAIHHLNTEQRMAFDIILQLAILGKGGSYFNDGPGGTGKSFLYKVLLVHIRSKGHIGIIFASSGITASCFLGGRTALSRFNIPIDGGTNIRCQMSFQSSDAKLIRASRIIIWDEAPMDEKHTIHVVDLLLQFLCENNSMFGGKLIIFGGDFRQVLLFVPKGSKKDQIDASIISSTIWNDIIKLRLTQNMRARDDPAFIKFPMRVENGQEPMNEHGEIQIPRPMLVPYTLVEESLEELIQHVYLDLSGFESAPFKMIKRTILCPKNDFVSDINAKLIARFRGDTVVYTSDDRAKSIKDQGDYVDYLNTLEPHGLPLHKFVLKRNSPIILLHNINPVEGLCNGTRLICKNLLPNVIGAIIASGQHRGKHVWIPKIPLETNPKDNKYLIPFVRRKLPLRLCFAMTINKSQGQTLDYVGLYLKQPVFCHGQLYVGPSRAKTGRNVKVLIIPPTCDHPGTEYTTNVVYNEVLMKASLT